MAPLLIQMQFEEPDPHPLRIWSMNADELQIFLSSEIKEESNEQRVKFIAILNFARRDTVELNMSSVCNVQSGTQKLINGCDFDENNFTNYYHAQKNIAF